MQGAVPWPSTPQTQPQQWIVASLQLFHSSTPIPAAPLTLSCTQAKSKEKQTVESSYHDLSYRMATQQKESGTLTQQLEESQTRVAALEAQLRDAIANKNSATLDLQHAQQAAREQDNQL